MQPESLARAEPEMTLHVFKDIVSWWHVWTPVVTNALHNGWVHSSAGGLSRLFFSSTYTSFPLHTSQLGISPWIVTLYLQDLFPWWVQTWERRFRAFWNPASLMTFKCVYMASLLRIRKIHFSGTNFTHSLIQMSVFCSQEIDSKRYKTNANYELSSVTLDKRYTYLL